MLKTHKKAQWDTQIKILKKTADGYGMPVDKGIIEVVAALNLLGATTTQSCEGHLLRGTRYPWINIGPTDEEVLYKELLKSIEVKEKAHALFRKKGLKFTPKVKQLYQQEYELMTKVRTEMLKELQKVWVFLVEFYTERGLNPDRELILIENSPIQGSIKSQGAIFQDIRSPKKQKEKLEEYQKEMESFGKFLKEKYLKH